MLPDRVSNPGPLTYEAGALLIALRSPALPLHTDETAEAGISGSVRGGAVSLAVILCSHCIASLYSSVGTDYAVVTLE